MTIACGRVALCGGGLVLDTLLFLRDLVVRVGPTTPAVGGTLGARLRERERDPMGDGVLFRKWEGKLEGGGGGSGW
jgi:hypothetical protein